MSTAPIAPRNNRRFWITVAAFAVANLLAWAVWDRYFAKAHRGTLHVASVDPGDNAAVAPNATLRWRFDADVIPTDVYAKPPGKSVPPVVGRWAWESPRTLAFVPAVELPRATPVTFTLATELLRTGTGAQLDHPVTTHVRPAPLTVKSVRQSATLDDAFIIELTFSDRVVPGDVLAHLSTQMVDGRGVRCQLLGHASGPVVRLRTETLPIGANGLVGELQVSLTPGLIGAAGPLGLDQPFQARVPLSNVLVATALAGDNPTRGRPSLNLSFNGEVETTLLRQILSVDPAIPYTLSNGYHGIELTGDFHPGVRYTVRLADPPKGTAAADRPRYPRPGSMSTFMPDLGTDCWMDADQGYLSTAGNRAMVAHVVNVDRLRVTATRVYDDNLVAWRNNADRGSYYYASREFDNFARPAGEKLVICPGPRNVRRDVRLSLDDLLPATLSRTGAWRVAIASVPTPDGTGETASVVERDSAIVTLSDIGLTAKRTRDGLVAWATSLRSATPMASVRVRAYTDKNQLLGTTTTDADGLARLDDLHPVQGETVAVLLADRAAPATDGGDASSDHPAELTWLDLRRTAWDLADTDTSGKPYLRTGHTAFVYADRGVYRPGETVHLRAVVRAPGDVAPKRSFPVQWRFRRPDLHDWRIVNAMLDADGATAADVPLPDNLPTGQWSAEISLAGDRGNPFGSATFGVEEFIPNRLKVDLKLGSTAGRYTIADEPLSADVHSDYLFGRPAAGLGVDLNARATPVPFTPAGWAGWTFGDRADVHRTETPRVTVRKTKQKGSKAESPATVTATLDGAGRYHGTFDVAELAHLDEDESHPNRYHGPWRLTADAAVREAGGRAVTVARQIDVDAVPAYLGIHRVGDGQPKPDAPCPFELRMVRPDGTPSDQPADITVRLLRETWNTSVSYRGGHYAYDSTRLLEPIETATLHAAGDVVHWSPTPMDPGRYVIEATDALTGTVATTSFYATDGQGWDDTVDRSHPDRLDVRVLGPGEPDAPGADERTRPAAPPQRVGTQARVLVAAPFAGRLLLTVETDDVVQSKVIEMTGSHVVVPVDVTAACQPGAFITATVLRPIDPNASWRSHRAFGVARLNVDPADRKLTIALTTPKELRPMRSLDVGLTVTDPDGNPVANAAVNVAAVDEGVCSLTGFTTPDPLSFFTARRALGVNSADLYGMLVPEMAQSEVGGDGSGPEISSRHRSPIGGHRVRPVALAWAAVRTDEAGHAIASFPVPAFQGQLRVMAVGYNANRVGSADRPVTVRSPLMAQTSWPRFAAPGDRFVVPVILFNNRPVGGIANVTIEPVGTDGLLSFDAALPQIELAPRGQRQFDLPVTVGSGVGVARVRLTATMNGESYQEEMELPVRPAAPTTEFGGIARGTTAGPTELTGLVPMVPGTGSVRVDVTPWPSLNLPKGLEYLNRYPYGCAEQTTSTLFPLVALGDIGKQVDPTRFDPERIREKVNSGVIQLIGMQTADGGLAMWSGGSQDWPWASVYAAHFLTVARTSGYPVPDDFYDRLLSYVRHQLDLSPSVTGGVEVQSYAAYVLALAGKPERTAMSRLAELVNAPDRKAEGPGMDGAGGDARLFLSLAELLAGRRDLAETLLPAGKPTVRTTREHEGNLGSPTRDRALMILAVEEIDPDRADLPELVQQLADAKWCCTQDVAFSVLAIGQYLRDEAGRHPKGYESARLLLDKTVLAETQGGAPLSWIGGVGAMHVELNGPSGAVGHIGWLQSGVPLSPPKAASNGMTVSRKYLTVDGGEIRGTVRTGDLVRVELTIDGPADLPNVVLDDLLPAGLEAENARLATAAHDGLEHDDDEPPVFGGVTDVRDDRVIVIGRISGTGHCRATYLARAVTPGVYVAPPARVEAMYDLNTNGLSATGKLVVTGAAANVAKAD